MSDDRRVIACNYKEATGVAAEGALAYVVPSHLGGNLPERIRVLVRSRGKRWVAKWEATGRLTNFRVKTLPPEHPRYADERLCPDVWDRYDDVGLALTVANLGRYADETRRPA